MDYVYLLLIAVSLSVDAFTVSVCNGMSMEMNGKRRVFIAAVFGIMQGIMPIIGFFLGTLILKYLHPYDGILSFVLLLAIGLKMIIDACKGDKCANIKFSVPAVLIQGIATSIDALAVGVTLTTLSISIWLSAGAIALTTFTLCILALIFGERIIRLFKGKTHVTQIIGGAVLIVIGLKILIETFV